MKKLIAILLVVGATLVFAKPGLDSDDDFYSPQNLANYILVLDGLIDQGEALFSAPGGDSSTPKDNLVKGDTGTQVHITFSVTRAKGDIMYFLAISRIKQGLGYSEAANVASLFADRAGLPHLGTLKEGENHVYHIVWLVKAESWPEVKKGMLKARGLNRKEADPMRAFMNAFEREKAAREQKRQANQSATAQRP